jgi:hypothetical protein
MSLPRSSARIRPGPDPDELYEQLTEVTRDIRKLRSELTKALRVRDCVRRLLGLSPAPDAVS